MASEQQEPTENADGCDPVRPGDSFEAAYGEPLERLLDLATWEAGDDWTETYDRINAGIRVAVEEEKENARRIRAYVFPRIKTGSNALPISGVYQATTGDLEALHRKVLFNGAVEVCDGTNVEHDTLPITLSQIGVALVSYQGNIQSFAHRLFRRDLQARSGDAFEDIMDLLDQRAQRDGTGVESEENPNLSSLARRGIMTYMERAVLAYRSTAAWRMGHGNPVSYELLTGSGIVERGRMPLIDLSLPMLRHLVLEHRKFVFVPSARNRLLGSLAQALRPLEYALLRPAEMDMLQVVDRGNYPTKYRKRLVEFCREVGPQIVCGVYRASPTAPGHVFYSHVDHAHEAALIALADSVLQEHRGFPLLIDLADALCQTTFGNDVFKQAVQAAYAHAGAPFRYLNERQTRK